MTLRAAPYIALMVSSCSWLDPQVGAPVTCPPSAAAAVDGGGYAGIAMTSSPPIDAGPSPAHYMPTSGNILIADQYNNRVIEITRSGTIVWAFGDGSNVPGPTSIVAPNDAERLPNRQTLIAATGAPPGGDYTCPTSGCPDNRVIIVDDDSGAIVWQYGAPPAAADKASADLNQPVCAVLVSTKGEEGVLITDQGHHRVIEVSLKTKAIGFHYDNLVGPNSAERLPNGDTLIADAGNHRVIVVDPTGTNIVWQYPGPSDTHKLVTPEFASRLPDGHTLITDAGTNEIIEIDASTPHNVVWSYSTASRNPCGPAPQPTRAVRLKNGHTLISDQFNDQIVEVDDSTPAKLVYTYGKLGIAGSGIGLLNAPYDAKVVGDYDGLTLPPDAGSGG